MTTEAMRRSDITTTTEAKVEAWAGRSNLTRMTLPESLTAIILMR